jgi:hypothetical protein
LFVVVVVLVVERKYFLSNASSAGYQPANGYEGSVEAKTGRGVELRDSPLFAKRGNENRTRKKDDEEFAASDALSSEESLRKWLSEPLSSLEAQMRMEKIASILHAKANESGDFSGFDLFLACRDSGQVSPWIEMYLSGVTSRHGDVYDVQNKFRILRNLEKIDKLGGQRLKMKIMEDAAPKILRSEAPELLAFFEGDDLRRVASLGSRENPAKMIEISSQIADPGKRKLAESAAMERFLESDSIAASSYIAQLADAETKNNVIAVMVKWLKGKGDNEEAMNWEKQIVEKKVLVPTESK